MRALPWSAMMAAGLGRLRLSPDSFWNMSPRELRAALGETNAPTALDRHALRALMALHPDRKEPNDR
jgi:uncharacterized phage protein (TIGR02216 family)